MAYSVSTVLACLLIAGGLFATSQAANCSIIVCQNGGTCNNFTDSPPCICPLPYIAPYCAAAADYCNTLQPDRGINDLPVCQNNGTCTITFTDPYFNCTCPYPYTDIRCNDTVAATISTTTTMSTATTTISTTTTSSTTTMSTATTTAETTSPSTKADNKNDLTTGAIIGIALGTTVAAAAVVAGTTVTILIKLGKVPAPTCVQKVGQEPISAL